MILVSHGSGSPVSSQCSGTGDEKEGKSRCRRDRVTEMLDMIVFLVSFQQRSCDITCCSGEFGLVEKVRNSSVYHFQAAIFQ